LWQLAGPPTSGGAVPAGQWQWSYNAILTAPQQLRQGSDFSALIDFPGYVAGSASWTNVAMGFTGNLTTENTTAGAFFGPGQSDSAALPNFRVTNAGALFGGGGMGPTTLGTLNLRTTAGGQQAPNLLDFFTLAQKDTDLTNVYTIGSVAGPVPEPGTYAMLLAGLAGIGFIARKRMKV
jgi:hypothetical protein